VEFAGAVYHLLDRGDRREAIFRDDRDRETFLTTLGQACERTGWRVHAWVLMTNHYHLLVETPEPNRGQRRGQSLRLTGEEKKGSVLKIDIISPTR
jgi:putative transposase